MENLSPDNQQAIINATQLVEQLQHDSERREVAIEDYFFCIGYVFLATTSKDATAIVYEPVATTIGKIGIPEAVLKNLEAERELLKHIPENNIADSMEEIEDLQSEQKDMDSTANEQDELTCQIYGQVAFIGKNIVGKTLGILGTLQPGNGVTAQTPSVAVTLTDATELTRRADPKLRGAQLARAVWHRIMENFKL